MENPSNIFSVINTALLSVTLTLASVIYRDMRGTLLKQGRQIIACLTAMILIVNHIEHLPESLLTDLQDALKEK